MADEHKPTLGEAYKSGLLEPGGCDDDIASEAEAGLNTPQEPNADQEGQHEGEGEKNA